MTTHKNPLFRQNTRELLRTKHYIGTTLTTEPFLDTVFSLMDLVCYVQPSCPKPESELDKTQENVNSSSATTDDCRLMLQLQEQPHSTLLGWALIEEKESRQEECLQPKMLQILDEIVIFSLENLKVKDLFSSG